MRVLLDTHALLWALAEPNRLSPSASALLRDPANAVWVSAASAWEISTKMRLGRLPGAEPIVAAYASHLRTLRANELPIRSDHALLAGSFAVEHRDPFDCMLAAQAILEGFPMLTNDRAFRAFDQLQTLW